MKLLGGHAVGVREAKRVHTIQKAQIDGLPPVYVTEGRPRRFNGLVFQYSSVTSIISVLYFAFVGTFYL